MTSKEKEMLGEFIKLARHVRNYPHPEIPIKRLYREATQAEMNAEYLLGKKEFEKIADKAFKNDKERT